LHPLLFVRGDGVAEIYILGFNGSPRKYGNTFKMLKMALLAAEREGARTRLFHLYDYNIKPCLGCLVDDQKACRYPCVIEDDMKEIYREILDADGIIIATPIYWYNVSGVLKNFIDRITVFENMINIEGRSWVEGKVAGVIAAGNDSGCISVISNLYAVLNSMGFAIPPWALAYKNNMLPLKSEKERLLDAANIGRCVALMAKLLKNGPEKWYSVDLAKWMEEIYPLVEEEAEENWRRQEPERRRIIKRR